VIIGYKQIPRVSYQMYDIPVAVVIRIMGFNYPWPGTCPRQVKIMDIRNAAHSREVCREKSVTKIINSTQDYKAYKMVSGARE